MPHLKFRRWISSGKLQRNEGESPYDYYHMEYNVYPTIEGIEDKIRFMQYTGLKDKDGKEIYENDVVNCEAMGNYITITMNYKLLAELEVYLEYTTLMGNIYETNL